MSYAAHNKELMLTRATADYPKRVENTSFFVYTTRQAHSC